MFQFLTIAIRRLKCRHGFHEGPIVKQGYPMIMGKKNKPAVTLNDLYWIRRCTCGESFSKPKDLIQKKDVPYLI